MRKEIYNNKSKMSIENKLPLELCDIVYQYSRTKHSQMSSPAGLIMKHFIKIAVSPECCDTGYCDIINHDDETIIEALSEYEPEPIVIYDRMTIWFRLRCKYGFQSVCEYNEWCDDLY